MSEITDGLSDRIAVAVREYGEKISTTEQIDALLASHDQNALLVATVARGMTVSIDPAASPQHQRLFAAAWMMGYAFALEAAEKMKA